MINNDAFRSVALIVLGATAFALLFVILGLMFDAAAGEAIRVTRSTLGFGSMAFFGYIAIGLFLRDHSAPSD
ncbi:MAG: hypothetical protein RhofKO_27600 [Rhodothermales bacterium]